MQHTEIDVFDLVFVGDENGRLVSCRALARRYRRETTPKVWGHWPETRVPKHRINWDLINQLAAIAYRRPD